MDAIRTISEVAKTLLESDAKYDQDICKMTILFPLLETLGYDSTKAGDIILNPAYIDSGEYKMDYGLRGIEEDSIKTMVKMIDLDAEPGLEFSNIRKCILPTTGVEYIIITDCFNYYIYANADNGMTFLDVVSFNITTIKKDQERSFNILANPNTAGRQDYALHDDEPAEESAPSVSVQKYIQPTVAPNAKKTANKKNLSTVGVIVITATICFLIVLSGALLGFADQTNINNWHKVIFNFNDMGINYYTLKGNVELKTYEDKLDYVKVEIEQTNLPANTLITLNFKNSAGLSFKTKVSTDVNGCVNQDVPIPSAWKNTQIYVVANVIFDDDQSQTAKDKFGMVGQYLVGIENDKTLLGESHVFYNYDAIEALIKEREEQKAAAELKALREYFSQFKVVQYSNGDMAFYPKGYDINDWESANNNITSTDKSYAKVYYNAKTQTGTFYYVVGTFMNAASWPNGTFILSDTVNSHEFSAKNGRFRYHMNKYGSITGWCQFDQNGINSLIPILTQIYSSGSSTIEFKDLHKISISAADKTAVLSIIDLYTKYFSNGSVVLNPEWFE